MIPNSANFEREVRDTNLCYNLSKTFAAFVVYKMWNIKDALLLAILVLAWNPIPIVLSCQILGKYWIHKILASTRSSNLSTFKILNIILLLWYSDYHHYTTSCHPMKYKLKPGTLSNFAWGVSEICETTDFATSKIYRLSSIKNSVKTVHHHHLKNPWHW